MAQPHYATFGSGMSWDGTQITFNVFDKGKAIRCAVTRSALAVVSGKLLTRTLDMLNSFAFWRDEIEALAWAKFRTRPIGIYGRVVVRSGDIDDPPTAGAVMKACPEVGLLQAA